VQVDGITKGIWPKGNADRLRPTLECVKKLLPGTLRQVLDGSLHYSILKVGIDPTEGESLIALLAHHLEVVVGKSTIVTGHSGTVGSWHCAGQQIVQMLAQLQSFPTS
jgi:hypothetical protein